MYKLSRGDVVPATLVSHLFWLAAGTPALPRRKIKSALSGVRA
jgi:hypothetical protein